MNQAMRLNLHSRLTQRVLIQLSQTFYRSEKDLYDAAFAVAWEIWFTTKQTFKIEITATQAANLTAGDNVYEIELYSGYTYIAFATGKAKVYQEIAR